MGTPEIAKASADKEMDKFEIESKLRTLQEAEEIKADAALMKKLAPHLKKKVKAIQSLADLRAAADACGREEESEE